MNTLTAFPATDVRGTKAVAIATKASQWLKCHDRSGRKAYGIPSSRGNGRYYLTTRTSCDCFDGQRRTCKHQLAVRLHCDLVAEQQRAGAPTARAVSHVGVIPAAQIERED